MTDKAPFKPLTVSYEDLTSSWMHEINGDGTSARTIDLLTESSSRPEAIATVIELTAAAHFNCPPGERIEQLTRWRSNVRARISDTYQLLLEEGIEPEVADADPVLDDVRAIELGLRRATFLEQRQMAAARQSGGAALPQVIDPAFFEPHP